MKRMIRCTEDIIKTQIQQMLEEIEDNEDMDDFSASNFKIYVQNVLNESGKMDERYLNSVVYDVLEENGYDGI